MKIRCHQKKKYEILKLDAVLENGGHFQCLQNGF